LEHLLGNTHIHTLYSDGKLSPLEVIKRYKILGYDFIILTDHSMSENPFRYPKLKGLIVIEGCEVSSREHYIYARAENVELRIKCHPNRYNDSIEEVETWNLYEVTEHARLQPRYFKCKAGFPIFSDDSHSLAGIGRTGILVKAKPKAKSILEAINNGNFRLWARELIR